MSITTTNEASYTPLLLSHHPEFHFYESHLCSYYCHVAVLCVNLQITEKTLYAFKLHANGILLYLFFCDLFLY
jgi:hypothetical protein